MKFPLVVLGIFPFVVTANVNKSSPDLTDLSVDELMQVNDTVELSLADRNLLYSSRQEFVIETWPSPSQIERSLFAKVKFEW